VILAELAGQGDRGESTSNSDSSGNKTVVSRQEGTKSYCPCTWSQVRVFGRWEDPNIHDVNKRNSDSPLSSDGESSKQSL
jgi:hypothetical protein